MKLVYEMLEFAVCKVILIDRMRKNRQRVRQRNRQRDKERKKERDREI